MILNLISLMMAFQLSRNGETALRRYPLALAGVVFAWSLMFLGAIFIQFSGQPASAILPPLERAVTATTILLLGWAFLTSSDQRWRDVSNNLLLLLLLVTTIAYTITGIFWVDLAANGVGFNMSSYGKIWSFILLGLPLFGMLLTIVTFSYVFDSPLKLVYFFVVLVGAGITTYQIVGVGLDGDDIGIFRLFFTLAQVIIPMIVYRIVVNSYETALTVAQVKPATQPMPAVKSQTVPEPPPRISEEDALNAKLLKAMGAMIESGNPKEIPRRVVDTVLDALRADVGALLRLQDANYADITIAQDRHMAQQLAGMSLNLGNQPTLVNAIERRSQRGLYADRNAIELEDLYTRLDIEHIGPVYFQPLVHAQEVFAVVMVALPYTKRELSPEEIELLKGIGIVGGNLLALSYKADEVASLAEDRIIQAMVEGVPPSDIKESQVLQARLEMQENLKNARAQIANLTHQVLELSTQLEHEQARVIHLVENSEEGLSISQKMVAVTEEQEHLRDERDKLAKRLQEAEAALQGAVATDSDSSLSNLVEALQREKEALEAEKARLYTQLQELRAQDNAVMPADMQSLLNRMMAEKQRLEDEHNQLNNQLSGIQHQLQDLGIEDNIVGLSQLISELHDERAALKEQIHLLQQERDALLHERENFVGTIGQEKDRNNRIRALEDSIQNLASDREAAVKLNDKLRNERDETLNKLNVVKEHRARLLAQSTGYEIELREARDEQMQLRAQIQELADIRSELTHNRDRLIAENRALLTDLEQAKSQISNNTQDSARINQEGMDALQKMVDELSQQRDNLARELNQAQLKVANIENELVLAHQSLEENQSNIGSYEPNNPELLVGLVQELRTPMTSISGYVDLLLAEDAGILGEKQNKYLKRVAANITRLSTMIESLVSVTHLDTGNYQLDPRPINVIYMVEEAITNASIQFREKNLAVALDLDDGMPLMAADEDSMKQVIEQLLTNAYLVTPPHNEIHVTVTRRSMRFNEAEETHLSLYVAVQDSGGGINPEDIEHVFARKYKAEYPLIEGLGDTGVGLAIAKTLVEAHKGKLWVESQAGVGSTFAFAIPFTSNSETEA